MAVCVDIVSVPRWLLGLLRCLLGLRAFGVVGVIGEASALAWAHPSSFMIARWNWGLLSASLIMIARSFESGTAATAARTPGEDSTPESVGELRGYDESESKPENSEVKFNMAIFG